MSRPNSPLLVKLGLTCILVGYFLVWLPQTITGLSFTGLEMGEWVKFLPQVRAGELLTDRHFFYIPPITMGILLTSWTTDWSNRRWQTWSARGLALAVSFLAFPVFEVIQFEPPDQWLVQLILISLVLLFVVITPLLGKMPQGQRTRFSLVMFLLFGVIGSILPSWVYLEIRPLASALFQRPVGVGPGVWLNAIGHILLAYVGLSGLARGE